jgi:hypothetical protein
MDILLESLGVGRGRSSIRIGSWRWSEELVVRCLFSLRVCTCIDWKN